MPKNCESRWKMYAVPDPCVDAPCDTNADCEREGLSANFTCTCRSPFIDGNGFNCSSKNGTLYLIKIT